MQYKAPNLLNKRFICWILFFPLLIAYSTATGFTPSANETERPAVAQNIKKPPLVSVSIENMPISQAVSLIEKKTDYHIKLQSIDPTEVVSGQFNERDIETVWINLLKNYNLAILVDTKKRLILVKSVGPKIDNGKSGRSVDSGMHAGGLIQVSDNEEAGDVLPLGIDSGSDRRESFTGMTSSEIATLHSKQAAQLEREQQNPESVVPFTGMTNAAIRALHEEQRKALVNNYTQP